MLLTLCHIASPYVVWQFIHRDIQDSLPGEGSGQTVAALIYCTLIVCQLLYRNNRYSPIEFSLVY